MAAEVAVVLDRVEHEFLLALAQRLVARLVPVQEPESPLERLIAAGILSPAEDPGDLLDVEPYPAIPDGRPTASEILRQMREEERY